jgi:VanZ family protein
MRPLKQLRLYIALGGLYLGALVYLTLTSAPPQGPQFPLADKWAHLGAYFLLMGWFGQLAVEHRAQNHEAHRLRANLALGFMVLGALLEGLQGLGGVRQMEFADAAANALGVWLGHTATQGPLGRMLQRFEA